MSMSKQEIFNKVSSHLLKQGVRSYGMSSKEGPSVYSGCLYRSREGYMCAVGCLIDNEHYSHKLEGQMADSGGVLEALQKSGVISIKELSTDALGVRDFICQLQKIHDIEDPEHWEYVLKHFQVVNELEWIHE